MDHTASDTGPPVGGGWVARLGRELDREGSLEQLSPAALAALLRLARDVAHGTERVNAPLSTYVAGRYVALRLHQGCTEMDAVEEVQAAVSRLLEDRAPPGG